MVFSSSELKTIRYSLNTEIAMVEIDIEKGVSSNGMMNKDELIEYHYDLLNICDKINNEIGY